jgi:hypothetical protein
MCKDFEDAIQNTREVMLGIGKQIKTRQKDKILVLV